MSNMAVAYNAALTFALETLDDNNDIILFLKLWHEGCWPEIEKHFPEFDLTTAAPCGYKPEPKQIDMTPFIVNGLDCEFSTNKHFHPNPTMNGNMGTLRISQLGGFEGKRFVDVHGISSPYCRPRLNHPFVWSNDLDLPKGLVIEYGHWNQSNELIWGAVSVRFGNKVGRITGCKEGHTFVG